MSEQEFEQYLDRWQRAVSRLMRSFGRQLATEETALTGPQFFLLSRLEQMGPAAVSQLAEELHVKPSSVTAMLDRLEQNGLIVRSREQGDRRVVQIMLSENGQQALVKARQKRRQVLKSYLQKLTAAERKTLLAILEKMAMNEE